MEVVGGRGREGLEPKARSQVATVYSDVQQGSRSFAFIHISVQGAMHLPRGLLLPAAACLLVRVETGLGRSKWHVLPVSTAHSIGLSSAVYSGGLQVAVGAQGLVPLGGCKP